MWISHTARILAGVLFIPLAITCTHARAQNGTTPPKPVKVTVHDEKAVIVRPVLPVMPGKFIQVNYYQNMYLNIRVDNKILHLGNIMTQLKIDGQTFPPGSPQGRMTKINERLPKSKTGKDRDGVMSVYEVNKIRITQTIEVVATKPSPKPKAGEKRRRDAVLVRYFIDNTDTRAHDVGIRVAMDMYLSSNDGALFYAPTVPKKVIDGIALEGKKVPDYLKVLERPNLQNPGYYAHFTYNFGKNYEMPTRVVVTRHGTQYTPWAINPTQAGGDSAMGFFWEPVKIAPGGKRQMAYSYGKGLASTESEGVVTVKFGGSFEPGKMFSMKAFVRDPQPGQSLQLELPESMKLLEGDALQPVPPADHNGLSLVLWKARVLRLGTFTLKIRSSTGVTQAKRITIEQASE